MKCAQRNEDYACMMRTQWNVLVDVHVVIRHAIVDVLCVLVIRVVIGVHIVVLSVHYNFVVHFRIDSPCCHTVVSSSHSFIVAIFHICFHCILTAF